MQKINCNFIGDFKLGDNINYNFSCLRVLYSSQDSMRMNNEDSSLFCKPITLIIVSIIEALLYDLFSRITNNTREGVRNIAEQVLNDVRSKTIDQLETYIAAARKHDLLGATGTDLYIKLDELRKVRNRVHIQNVKKQLEQDEVDVYTFARQHDAEKILELVLKHASNNFQRPKHTCGYVGDFSLPWNQHIN